MLPVIAIVGRPNVGKSTLFNCFTRTRNAIVADQPGVTRDRQYGMGRVGEFPYWVVDTGGIGDVINPIEEGTEKQTILAAKEADHILFMIDAKEGMTASDETISNQLRLLGKPVTLVLNKTDGVNAEVAAAEYYQLGWGEPFPIAAAHQRGTLSLINHIFESLPHENQEEIPDAIKNSIRIAIVGKPNVGKSTLVNRILGEERVLVFDEPGTTRDSIYIPFTRFEQAYTLIDTAGVRRRSRIDDTIEKFSVIKTLEAIRRSHVVVMVLDAQEGIAEQDLKLIGHILDAGRSVVLAINKWDNLANDKKEWCKRELDRRLTFLDYAESFYISALHGTGVGLLYDAILRAHASATKTVSTPQLTRILTEAQEAYQPPLVRGRMIKLRYAHFGGQNPPCIVIHGNQTAELPKSYHRYLENYFRKKLEMVGTPIRLEFKTSANPFAGIKNPLNAHQVQKRTRLMKFIKKQKRKS